jgi:type IV pilus assembly protein PilN
MRIDINLASQPYEDVRQFWTRWGTAVGTVGLFTLLLLALVATNWIDARRDQSAMSQARDLIAKCDDKRSNAERILNLPQNRTTRDESQFLNELIERKAFSWTRVLENLESVMPPRVHVVSISPRLDEDNQLALKMTVAGDSRDRAIELARRMEASRRFAQTSVIHEAHIDSQTGDTEQFEIAAIYVPEQVASVGDEAAPASTGKKAQAGTKPKTEVAKRSKP